MDMLERMSRTEFLGREFLTWLWFRSETQGGMFELDAAESVEVWIDDRVTLQSDADQAVETITCSGENSDLREARFALAENKKVTQARFRMAMGEDEWSFTLESSRLNVKSLKPPRVVQDVRDDPDGLFFERVRLMERAVSVLDALFLSFVSLRVSEAWSAREVPGMARWIREGTQARKRPE
jgi:recombination associated protein RdgC